MKSSVGPFVRFVSSILGSLPRSWVRGAASVLGFVWFDILRLRRRVILENLQIAFPEKDLAWKLRVGRASVQKLCANFTELLTIPAMNQNWIQKHAVFEGWQNLENAKAKGKGILMLSLHVGTYDVAASLLPMRGEETYLISKDFKNPRLNEFWFSIRGSQGVRYIPAHSDKTAFDILKALKRKASVIFVIDQFMGKPFGIESTFFGRSTGTAYGLALFAMKTGAPVIPMYSVEGADGKIHFIAEPEIDTAPYIDDNQKEKSLQLLTQRFTDVIESIVRKYPEEWLWVHRRWKKFE